jgi:zinc/manganese transport system substrate-binding protein
MFQRFLLLILLLLSGTPALADTAPLPVVASISIIGNMVKEIGGPDVDVTTLVGPNGDAHTYEPKPGDIKILTQSRILLLNGLGLEGWMPRLTEAANFKGETVIVSEGVKPRTMKADEDSLAAKAGAVITDPHAWQDLSNGLIYARNIAAALERALPAKAEDIAARATAYQVKIKAMDQKVRAEMSAIPTAKRRIITSHDAFGYFGAAYGVEFLAPVGLSTEAEPSAGDLARLIRQMKQEGIKTVFLENMTSPRLAETLAGEGGAKLGATLYSDALSEPDGPAPTYLGMFENNLPKLIEAMRENGS